MIGWLKGRIVERSEDGLVLDVNGVGYELQCSLSTIDAVLGFEEACLWVQTQVREDAITLFGFATTLEKRMFLSLIKVNGVGPKMAIKILSGTSLQNLSAMIESGDVKALSNLPKVGKKTAEQLILSLKGKLSVESDGARVAHPRLTAVLPAARFTGLQAEISSALVNLGFRAPDVEKVVTDLPPGVDLQQGIRQGLQALTGGH